MACKGRTLQLYAAEEFVTGVCGNNYEGILASMYF
jgi:hypothetical protein